MKRIEALGLALLAAAISVTGAALADQRTFREDGDPATFFGYVQYCNPVFLQGFAGQVGKTEPIALRVWVGHKDRTGKLDWKMSTGGPIEANQPNGEGEVVLGYPCGFSLNFQQLAEGEKPVAGDQIWVYVARTADGRQPRYWRLFERTVGTGGNPNANPDKGESQGVAFFQGRVTHIRPDSVRGYAVDDLALSGETGPQVFYPVKVLVEIGKRAIDSTEAFRRVELVETTAGEETEIPLYLTDPPGEGTAGTTWKYGFTANLKNRLEEGAEYQITLYETSLNKLVLDRRIHRIASKESLPVIASFEIAKTGGDAAGSPDSPDAAGGGALELELVRDLDSKRKETVSEKMATRALLSKDEFFRFTPGGGGEGSAGGWQPAPERLYDFAGETVTLERASLPGPAGDAAPEPATEVFRAAGRGGSSAPGGFDAGGTRSLWVRLIREEGDPEARREKKQYLYEWQYPEAFYETHLYAYYRNVRGAEIESSWAGLVLPDAATPSGDPGTVVDPDAAPPASGDSSGATTSVTNAYITVLLDDTGTRPVPWESLDEAQRDGLVAQHGAKLDEELNSYDEIRLGVGAFSRQSIDASNASTDAAPDPATASNPLLDPTTTPSLDDSKMAGVTLRVTGDHHFAPYDDPQEANHPLFVSVRYVYDRAVEALGAPAAPADPADPGNPVDPTAPGETPPRRAPIRTPGERLPRAIR